MDSLGFVESRGARVDVFVDDGGRVAAALVVAKGAGAVVAVLHPAFRPGTREIASLDVIFGGPPIVPDDVVLSCQPGGDAAGAFPKGVTVPVMKRPDGSTGPGIPAIGTRGIGG